MCKRGPMGAVAFTGAIPDTLDEGESGPGFAIEVFNVLGAGDGFMSGLLKGWLDGPRDAPDWPTALTYANACGALAVSRHGCAPAYPSWEELRFFLDRGVRVPALRHDAELERVHWATNRAGEWPAMRVFAFDHRSQMEEMEGATPERIGAFKRLCLRAALRVADGRQGYGILCDGRLGRDGAARGRGYRALDRPARGVAGLAAPGARARDRPRLRGAPRVAARAGRQVPLLLPPGRRRRRSGPRSLRRWSGSSPPPGATGWRCSWRSSPPRSAPWTTTPPRA